MNNHKIKNEILQLYSKATDIAFADYSIERTTEMKILEKKYRNRKNVPLNAIDKLKLKQFRRELYKSNACKRTPEYKRKKYATQKIYNNIHAKEISIYQKNYREKIKEDDILNDHYKAYRTKYYKRYYRNNIEKYNGFEKNNIALKI